MKAENYHVHGPAFPEEQLHGYSGNHVEGLSKFVSQYQLEVQIISYLDILLDMFQESSSSCVGWVVDFSSHHRWIQGLMLR